MLVISDDTMKLGVNNNVNRESHKASLKLIAGGPSKVKPPNSHPANPIHKKATEAQGLAVKKKQHKHKHKYKHQNKLLLQQHRQQLSLLTHIT